MLARDLVIILVLFGLVSGVGYLIVVDIAGPSGYDVENMTDEDYVNRYDTLTNSTRDIRLMQNETTSKEGMSVISTFTTFFKSTFTIIGIVFGSFDMLILLMSSFAQDTGINSGLANIVAGAIMLIVTTLIVFIVVSSVSRGRL